MNGLRNARNCSSKVLAIRCTASSSVDGLVPMVRLIDGGTRRGSTTCSRNPRSSPADCRFRPSAKHLSPTMCFHRCSVRPAPLPGPWRAHARPPRTPTASRRYRETLRPEPAFATLEVLRDGRDWDDFADERGLVPVSLRDAIRIPRQDWIADSEGEVSSTGLRLAIGRTHHYQGCASYIRSPNSSCIRRRVRADWSTAAEVRTGPRNTFRTSWYAVMQLRLGR